MKVIARRLTTDALAIEDEQERKAAMQPRPPRRVLRRRRRRAHPGRHRGRHRGHPGRPRRRPVPAQLPQRHPRPAHRRAARPRPRRPAHQDDRRRLPTRQRHGAEFAKFLEPRPARPGDARLPRPAARPRAGRPGGRAHPADLPRRSAPTARARFIGAVLAALGDYADAADPDLLTARTFDAHPTGVADLFGLRLAVLHESDAGPPAGRGHRQAAHRRRPAQGPPDAGGLLVFEPVPHLRDAHQPQARRHRHRRGDLAAAAARARGTW